MRSRFELLATWAVLLGACGVAAVIVLATLAAPVSNGIEKGGHGTTVVVIPQLIFNVTPLVAFWVALRFGGRAVLFAAALFAGLLGLFSAFGFYMATLGIPTSAGDGTRSYAIAETGAMTMVDWLVVATAARALRRTAPPPPAPAPADQVGRPDRTMRALAVVAWIAGVDAAAGVIGTSLTFFQPWRGAWPSRIGTFLAADLMGAVPLMIAGVLVVAAGIRLWSWSGAGEVRQAAALARARMFFGAGIPVSLFGLFMAMLGLGFLSVEGDPVAVVAKNVGGAATLLFVPLDIGLLLAAMLARVRPSRRGQLTSPAV